MKYLPCDQIARPTTGVSQALRFRKVCLLASQLLCQQLLLGDVHGGTEKPFENSLFNDGNSHAANIAQLTVRSNNSLCYVAATVLLMHDLNRFSHGGSILRMNDGQILLNRGGPVPRIQAINLVQLVRPIVT